MYACKGHQLSGIWVGTAGAFDQVVERHAHDGVWALECNAVGFVRVLDEMATWDPWRSRI